MHSRECTQRIIGGSSTGQNEGVLGQACEEASASVDWRRKCRASSCRTSTNTGEDVWSSFQHQLRRSSALVDGNRGSARGDIQVVQRQHRQTSLNNDKQRVSDLKFRKSPVETQRAEIEQFRTSKHRLAKLVDKIFPICSPVVSSSLMNTRCSLNADKADLLEPASIQVRVAFRHRSCDTGENELDVSGSDAN